MTAPLVLQLTDAGTAAVQAASGSDPTTISQIGLTATAFDFAPTLTALPGEFKRLDVTSGQAAAPNISHLTAYDTSADVWEASGLGLFLDDGTLFAVYAAPQVVMAKSSLAFALLAFDILFAADIAGNIAYGNATFAYPPATPDMRGVAELATQAEADAGTDDLRIVTPARGKAAVAQWLLQRDLHLGCVIVDTPDDGTTGGLRVAANPASGFGYIQIISPDLQDDWGAWRVGVDGTANWLGAGGLRVNDHTVWHAGNHGAGSGLDADLLDGQQGSDYAKAADLDGEATARANGDAALQAQVTTLATRDYVTEQHLAENGGYLIYASGRKETWGRISIPANAIGTFTLPTDHSAWVNPSFAVSSESGNVNIQENTGIAAIIGSPPTAIQVWNADDRTVTVWLRTIGV